MRFCNIVNAVFDGSDMRDVDLRNVTGQTSSLQKVNLSNANAFGCNLENSDLDYSNISGVDFTGATLIRVDFKDVNMKNAKFLGADMTGAANYKDKMTDKQKLGILDLSI